MFYLKQTETEDLTDGCKGMFLVFIFVCSTLPSISAVTREYYIAAVIREWNYAPSGQNQIKGVALDDDRYAKSSFYYMLLLSHKPIVRANPKYY